MAVTYHEVNISSDSRGFVFEPMGGNSLFTQRNVHVVISVPGAVRGNHYHVKGKETIAAMGPALVRIREGSEIRDIPIPEGKIYRFVFPPGVSHAIQNLGDQPGILVAFNCLEHDPRNPDLVKDTLIYDQGRDGIK